MDTKVTITAKLRAAFVTVYKGKCQYCTSDGANHIEHIKPRSKDGEDDLLNLTLACEPCNLRKGALELPEAY